MSLAIPMPERPRRARGRLQLLAIIGLVVGPMLLASAMYKWNFWVPQGRSYSGALIGNGQTPADLGVQGRSQGEQWQLLVTAPGTCGEDCQQLVYLAARSTSPSAAKPRAPATPWPPVASCRRTSPTW